MAIRFLDWEGNEIKDGMTIYFVRTKPLFTGRVGLLIPEGTSPTGRIAQVWESDEAYQKRMSEEIWELGAPFLVSEKDGRWYVTVTECDVSYTFPIMDKEQDDSVVAIKGISDKKE